MTDEPSTPDRPDEPAEEDVPRRPSTPGAAAASRARRIGGRPATPRATEPATAVGDEPAVALAKPSKAAAAEDPDAEDPGAGDSAIEDADAERAAADPVDTPETTVKPAVPAWLTWAPAGVLAVGAVVMAALLLAFSHGVWWGPEPGAKPKASSVNLTREKILAAAKSCVVAANDYDYRDLNGYESKALACTTGTLTGKLRNTIESLIKKNAPTIKAKQTTQISRGGIETVTPDGKQWTLLIFGQLSVVNSNYPKGRTDPFGAEVRVEQVKGKWVMSDLTVVSSPIQG